MYDSKEYLIKEIVEGTGVSQGSLYRAINQKKSKKHRMNKALNFSMHL